MIFPFPMAVVAIERYAMTLFRGELPKIDMIGLFFITIVAISSIAGTLMRGGILTALGRLLGVEKVRFRTLLTIGLAGTFVATTFRMLAFFCYNLSPLDSYLSGGPNGLLIAFGSAFASTAMIGWLIWIFYRLKPARCFVWAVATELCFLVLATGWLWLVHLALIDSTVVENQTMAQLLDGPRFNLTCDNCEAQFAYGLSSDKESPKTFVPQCPYCGTDQPRFYPNSSEIEETDQAILTRSGAIKRWDLVRFRRPDDRTKMGIARVVGLPGEKIELFDGDLFINGQRYNKLPSEAFNGLATLYDTNFVPSDPKKSRYGWRPVESKNDSVESTGWVRGENNFGWQCDTRKGDSKILRFHGPLSSRLDYNRFLQNREARFPPLHDLRLSFSVKRFPKSSAMTVRYRFRGQTILATFDALNNLRLEATGPNVFSKKYEIQLHRSPGFYPMELRISDGRAFVQHGWSPIAFLELGAPDIVRARQELAEYRKENKVENEVELEFELHQGQAWISSISIQSEPYRFSREELTRAGLSSGQSLSEKNKQSGYWLLSENGSLEPIDSRRFGPIEEKNIEGIVRWRLGPCRRWQRVGK
jgi:signal peptidase I